MLDRLVSGAAFRVEKLQDFLKGLDVRGVAQERALAANENKIFISEFVEVMGQRGVRDVELRLNFADDQALGMGRKEGLHNSQAWFGAHRREHIGEFCYVFCVLFIGSHASSIIAEIWIDVKNGLR